MRVSQIIEFDTKDEVNAWLLENPHIEIVNISLTVSHTWRFYMIHYKVNAKFVDENTISN